MADDIKLDKDPRSTWGASAAYRAAWTAKYGTVTPSRSASKAEWVKFASSPAGGMTEEDAEAMNRDDLADKYGAHEAVVAPSAPNESTAPAGQGAEGNVASDPMKQGGSTTTR